MSVRFTAASSEFLEIDTSPLEYNADFTICGWWYATSFTNGPICHLGVEGSNRMDAIQVINSHLHVLSYNGTDLIYTEGTTNIDGAWFHVCLRRNGSTVDGLVNGAVEITGTVPPTGRSNSTSMKLGSHIDNSSSYGDGRAGGGWKAWSRALSDAEVRNEMRSVRPVSLVSLYGWWPFTTGNATTRSYDYSGRGHNWTETNTPTTEADPPVSWGGRRRQIGVPSSGGSNVTITPTSATLSLSTFAPVLRETTTPSTTALTLTTFAPVIAQTLTPTAASLALSTFAPVLRETITPSTTALTLTTFAPVIGAPVTVTPSTLGLTLTTFAPVVSYASSGDIYIEVGTATLSQGRFAPQLIWTFTPTTAALVLTGYAPTVSDGGTVVTPTTSALVLTGYAPTVDNTTPIPVITIGYWVGGSSITAGSEWRVIATGPSADTPELRLTARFLER